MSAFSSVGSGIFVGSVAENGGGGGSVAEVANQDGTLTINPTTGNVIASRPGITGDVSVPSGSNAAVLESTANVQSIIANSSVQHVVSGDGTLSVALVGGTATIDNAELALVTGGNTFQGFQTFDNVITADGGVATTKLTSGGLPSLSSIMSHVAAGTTGATDQNTTGSDITIAVIVESTASANSVASLAIGPTSGSLTAVWNFATPSQVTGTIHNTLVIKIPAGWYVEWTTWTNMIVGGTPTYWY